MARPIVRRFLFPAAALAAAALLSRAHHGVPAPEAPPAAVAAAPATRPRVAPREARDPEKRTRRRSPGGLMRVGSTEGVRPWRDNAAIRSSRFNAA